jgi:site-specific recombinase XerD
VTPLRVAQQLSGHADIRTTQKHYLQVQTQQIDAARLAIEVSLKCVN